MASRDYIVHATMSSTFQGPHLNPEDLRAIWGQIATDSRAVEANAGTALGTWAHPAPRIVREASTFPPSASTHAVGLWVLPETPEAERERKERLVRELVGRNIAPHFNADAATCIGCGGGVVIVPYDPAVNGPREFWTSSQHELTSTARAFPSGTDEALRARENPVGPGTSGPAPLSIPGGLPDMGGWLKAGAVIAVAGAVIAVAVYSKPIVDMFATKRVPRGNPSRRRRRRSR